MLSSTSPAVLQDDPVEDSPQNDNPLLSQFRARQSKSLDAEREQAVSKRHARGYRSARENLEQLCDADSFVEYGQLAVAAQRLRKVFAATDIGPIEVQALNGVVDLVAEDEQQATEYAKSCLSYFQGKQSHWECEDQRQLRHILPADRRYAYDVRKVIRLLADRTSFTELKAGYGGAIITGFMRIQGQPIGLLASDCKVLGGAIDIAAGEKATDFMHLCEQFKLPIVSLCDTPGFMVGPKHEELGAVRRLAQQYAKGQASEVASILEIDGVIDPAHSRKIIIQALQGAQN